MKTNFTRAKGVIDALLPVAEKLVHGPLDETIATRLGQLSRAYGGKLLANDREPVDYSKTTTHIAYAYASGTARDRLQQAQTLYRLHPSLDKVYLDRRIREETINDYGIEALES